MHAEVSIHLSVDGTPSMRHHALRDSAWITIASDADNGNQVRVTLFYDDDDQLLDLLHTIAGCAGLSL